MSAWQAVAAELDALEHELHAAVASAFEAGKQRLTTYAVEPGGIDPRAEPGHVAVGKVDTVKLKT